jgi:hypothetical protein
MSVDPRSPSRPRVVAICAASAVVTVLAAFATRLSSSPTAQGHPVDRSGYGQRAATNSPAPVDSRASSTR